MSFKKFLIVGALVGVTLGSIVSVNVASAATPAQDNARRKAAEYLQFEAFSRSGLIKQLKFEGFTTAQATYGVNANHVNWNKQAAKKAKEYLKLEAFSRSGLIKQLRFEGFTAAQAAYGVRKTGL